jgi:hypothetical protein
MLTLTRSGKVPSIPKEFVQPTIVAGVGALGRGRDQEALIRFITTIAQTMGPEAIAKYIDASEYLKRLAAAQGIEVLNLVKDRTTVAARAATTTTDASTTRTWLSKQVNSLAHQ